MRRRILRPICDITQISFMNGPKLHSLLKEDLLVRGTKQKRSQKALGAFFFSKSV